MILKNNSIGKKQLEKSNWKRPGNNIFLLPVCLLLITIFSFATCKYGFKDTAPIPEEIKTFRVNYFENRAEYKNPQLSPQLTEKLKQKIIGTTRLRQSNNDDAHYDIKFGKIQK